MYSMRSSQAGFIPSPISRGAAEPVLAKHKRRIASKRPWCGAKLRLRDSVLSSRAASCAILAIRAMPACSSPSSPMTNSYSRSHNPEMRESHYLQRLQSGIDEGRDVVDLPSGPLESAPGAPSVTAKCDDSVRTVAATLSAGKGLQFAMIPTSGARRCTGRQRGHLRAAKLPDAMQSGEASVYPGGLNSGQINSRETLPEASPRLDDGWQAGFPRDLSIPYCVHR